MVRPENLEELVAKYLDETASEQEREELNRWFREARLDAGSWQAERPDEEAQLKAEMLAVINQKTGKQNDGVSKKRYWARFAVAASILILFSAGIYFKIQKQQPVISVAKNTDALPGSDGAILTLSNGAKIILGKNSNQNDVPPADHIHRLSDSSLVYQQGTQAAVADVSNNTLTTPNGKQFNVILPDGTRVWMNAGSSLQYPVAFTGKERLVKLSGEAYFEVAHNERMPFRVLIKDGAVNDIGTSFNINAYPDERTTTVTLVEGSASVTHNEANKTLRPGQQAVVAATSAGIAVTEADLETALAWKNGLFHFDHVSLEAALKQISRWYDLEIVYEGNKPDMVINGEIYRDVKASQLFAILGKINVKFRIEGNKLIVVEQKQ